MKRSCFPIVLSAFFCALFIAGASANAQIVDNFQSYTVGALPAPTWHDAGAVLPGNRVPSFPSGYVINTTDAFGHATKAVTTVGDLADSKGIYAFVPISNHYNLRADARIDRYSDHPESPTGDWAMQLSFGQNGADNWASTPQAGIYAASLTQGWRLYVATNNFGLDLDLGVAATPGVWYTVAQDFDVFAGIFHSQIWDTATGTQLLDTFTTLSGWDPNDAAQFDAFAFFGGDLSAEDTFGSIGVIDNVNIVAVTTPEPGTLALALGGLIPFAVSVRRRRTRG
jgi:hypothetical protein